MIARSTRTILTSSHLQDASLTIANHVSPMTLFGSFYSGQLFARISSLRGDLSILRTSELPFRYFEPSNRPHLLATELRTAFPYFRFVLGIAASSPKWRRCGSRRLFLLPSQNPPFPAPQPKSHNIDRDAHLILLLILLTDENVDEDEGEVPPSPLLLEEATMLNATSSAFLSCPRLSASR